MTLLNPGRLLIGALLVTAGGLGLLGQAGVLDASTVIGRGWPLVLVAVGVMQIALDPGARFSPLLLIGSGMALLAVTTGVVSATAWRAVLPLVLVAVGGWVILGRPVARYRSPDDATVHMVVAFAARRTAAGSQEYRGGSASVFFGSGELDLRDAVPVPGGARLGATVVFGNLFVIVPAGWDTTMRGIPILGGWDDTTHQHGLQPGAPRLRVGGLVLFGGLEVRHAERWS